MLDLETEVMAVRARTVLRRVDTGEFRSHKRNGHRLEERRRQRLRRQKHREDEAGYLP